MANLADAMNTWNYALELIQRRGYEIRRDICDEEGELKGQVIGYSGIRRIEGSDVILSAETPVSLLGIIAIWEEWGDGWQEADIPDWYEMIE